LDQKRSATVKELFKLKTIVMKVEKLIIDVSDSLGSVSAEIVKGHDMDFVYVFAHGAGAGMTHPFMVKLSQALAGLGIGTLRYNFPYMEKNTKRPDPPAIVEKTVVRAIVAANSLFPSIPLLAGGKSFGGRMTSQALSKVPHPSVAGLVFTGFPLHPPGKPGTDRAAHLANLKVPMLFLQGTRDALARITLMEQLCDEHPMAVLNKFEGADHSFKAGKQDLIPLLAQSIRQWASRTPLPSTGSGNG
jgi:predicted alpha/beta-hydrolase family hydrolase